jgi:CheY-like chemotaxis protein
LTSGKRYCNNYIDYSYCIDCFDRFRFPIPNGKGADRQANLYLLWSRAYSPQELTLPVRNSRKKYGGLSLSNKGNFANYYIKKNDNNSPHSGIALRGYRKDSTNKYKPRTRLLIVDDDSDVAHVLKLGLQKNGFLVDAFTNPEKALQNFKADAESYFLVLSDIRMPVISGIQLAKRVKEINPNVKVVLMTAFEIRDNEFSKVFPSTQVDGFVQKPIGIGDLTNKISSLIGET